MTKKRMVLEIGMGTDIRGADPTKPPAGLFAMRFGITHCRSQLRLASRWMQ